MKRISTLLITCLMCITATTYGQDLGLPQPSPWAQVSQKFGMAQATITYSRPSMKGRKIFGGLVPNGELWRTGANKCVQFQIEGDVTINGTKIPAGTYSLFTIPNESEWQIVINKDTEMWGTGGYTQDHDLMRFAVKTHTHTSTESFTIDFANITPNSVEVQLYWENTMVSFTLMNDFVEAGRQNIEAAIKQAENTLGLYDDAADFYLNNNLDAKMALDWAKKSVAQGEKYWNVYTLARAYAANGMKAEAISTGERSLALAKEAKNTGFAQTVESDLMEWKK
ncbi:MAG: DUF2911 domain-containing protein [Chitinophagales bacterium]